MKKGERIVLVLLIFIIMGLIGFITYSYYSFYKKSDSVKKVQIEKTQINQKNQGLSNNTDKKEIKYSNFKIVLKEKSLYINDEQISIGISDIKELKLGDKYLIIAIKNNEFKKIKDVDYIYYLTGKENGNIEFITSNLEIKEKADIVLQASGWAGASNNYIILKDNILYYYLSEDGGINSKGNLSIIAIGIDKIEANGEEIQVTKNQDFKEINEKPMFLEYK